MEEKERHLKPRQLLAAQRYTDAKTQVPVPNMIYKDETPFIAIVGPRFSGKSALFSKLIFEMTKMPINENASIVTISNSKQRISVYKAESNLETYIDCSKVADLIILTIDSVSFEMDTFEITSLLKSHGLCKILIAVQFNNDKKKRMTLIKKRMWKEIAGGLKVFDIGKDSDISNMVRTILGMKYRPLQWKCSNSYVIADKIIWCEDEKKCEFYGYVRGCPFESEMVHIPGKGDYKIEEIVEISDPCSFTKKRLLDREKKIVYAPKFIADKCEENQNIDYKNDSIYDKENELRDSINFFCENTETAIDHKNNIKGDEKNFNNIGYNDISSKKITTEDSFIGNCYLNEDRKTNLIETSKLEEDSFEDQNDYDDIQSINLVEKSKYEEESYENQNYKNKKYKANPIETSKLIEDGFEDQNVLDEQHCGDSIKNSKLQKGSLENQNDLDKKHCGDSIKKLKSQKDRLENQNNLDKQHDVVSIEKLKLEQDRFNEKISIKDKIKSLKLKLKDKFEHKPENEEDFVAKFNKIVKEKTIETDKEKRIAQEEKNKINNHNLAPGKYVKIVINIEKTNFNSLTILGSVNNQNKITLQGKVKRTNYFNCLLKSNREYMFSIGWRRERYPCVFSIKDTIRNRFIKYNLENMHCNVSFKSNLVPPGTPFCIIKEKSYVKEGNNVEIKIEDEEDKKIFVETTNHFRIAAIGSITDVSGDTQLLKKLKLIGYPKKIYENTVFVKDMFSSDKEAAKFEGGLLKTVSGIRGSIKKASGNNGDFRATFEGRLLMSDIIFMRCYVPYEVTDTIEEQIIEKPKIDKEIKKNLTQIVEKKKKRKHIEEVKKLKSKLIFDNKSVKEETSIFNIHINPQKEEFLKLKNIVNKKRKLILYENEQKIKMELKEKEIQEKKKEASKKTGLKKNIIDSKQTKLLGKKRKRTNKRSK